MKRNTTLLLLGLSCLSAILLFGCGNKKTSADKNQTKAETKEDETMTYAKTILVDETLTKKEGEQYATLT